MSRALVAILLSIFSVFIFSIAASFLDRGFSKMWGMDVVIFQSAVTAAVALVVLLIWGLPIHLLLRRWNKNSIYYYICFGFVPGAVLVILAKPFGNDSFGLLIIQTIYLGVLGSVAATVFWLVIRRKNA